MSGKPLVPSKDALRTLRHLAYSPPAAFIGATGALCGIATLQYYERQKVRCAEEILKTKRKLHSISRGKGSARLASMFEAAERGEDFTLHKGRPKKILRRQHSTALKVEEESEGHTGWKPFSSDDEASPDSWPEYGSSRAAATHSNAGRNTAPIEEIYSTSKPWKLRQPNDRYTWPQLVRKHGIGARRTDEAVRKILEASRRPSRSGIRDTSQAVQSLTDLHPLKGMLENPSVSVANSISSISFDDRISLSFDPSKSSASVGFGLLQPWQVPPDTMNDSTNKHDQSTTLSTDSTDSDLYLDAIAPIPTVRANHPFQSRYNFEDWTVRKGMSLVGMNRYMYVFNSLMNFRHHHGKEAAIALLGQTMHRYTATNKRPDFALMQALFLDCTRLFSTAELKPLVWGLVEEFLRGDAPRLEVVSLLYPRCGAGDHSGRQHYYFLAHQYLEALQRKGHSLDRQVLELRKVLSGTRVSNIAFHEHLMIPVLRAFCMAGRMTSAQALFNEMTMTYKIPVTFYSLQILIKGYANVGHWSKVKSMLDEYHSRLLSEQKVYGFSNLLVSIVNDYSLLQPAEQVVKFIMHCIEQYGVQPISSMTREVISLCLRQRRYDLIVAWIEMVRRDFPHIEIGTESSTFAFDIASVWRDTGASCEDILAGCRAIATQSLRDPFSKAFRASISEAVSSYMLPRLQALRTELGPDVPDFATGEINQFHSALKALKFKAATQLQGSRARLQLMDLLNQAEALRWLNALCRGHLESQGVASRSVQLQFSSEGNNAVEDKLPPLDDLQSILMKQYSQRRKNGQDVEHESLAKTVKQLVQQDRQVDAYSLIRSIYDSQWAQPPHGREFDLDLFTDWLRITWVLKSGSKLRAVLWALIDASPQLKLSSHIILLARIAAPKTHLQNVKRARTNEVDEVEYLRLRLRRRHWMTSGLENSLRFDEWHGIGKPSTIRQVEV